MYFFENIIVHVLWFRCGFFFLMPSLHMHIPKMAIKLQNVFTPFQEWRSHCGSGSMCEWHLRGGPLSFPSCRWAPSPECVGGSEPWSRTLIVSTALTDTLNVVLRVWSGHQSLRGRIGKWVYVWSEGFEGLVTLSGRTGLPPWSKSLHRIVQTARHRDKTFTQRRRTTGTTQGLGIFT